MNTPSQPSFRYGGGQLEIDAPAARMRIQWLPAPLAEKKVVGMKSWQAFWPEFRLIRPDAPAEEWTTPTEADHKSAAYASFRSQIPSNLLCIVAPFKSHQWPLLVLMHEQPGAMDLATSNPVLAYALANNNELRGTTIDAAGFQAVAYSHRKQRFIVGWLGFPDTEAMVKLFKKIPPDAVSPSLLRRLRNAIGAAPDVLEILSHQKSINTEILDLVVNAYSRVLVTPKLLKEIASLEADSDVSPSALIDDGLSILHEFDPDRKVRPFTSIAQAQRFLQQIDEEYQRHLQRLEEQRLQEEERRRKQRERERKNANIFPPPPVPGTASIMPITTARELKAEGAAQSNCVWSRRTLIARGHLYIYKVLAPERATLAIRRGSDGCWQRLELKAAHNRQVKHETWREVDAWLGQYSISV